MVVAWGLFFVLLFFLVGVLFVWYSFFPGCVVQIWIAVVFFLVALVASVGSLLLAMVSLFLAHLVSGSMFLLFVCLAVVFVFLSFFISGVGRCGGFVACWGLLCLVSNILWFF